MRWSMLLVAGLAWGPSTAASDELVRSATTASGGRAGNLQFTLSYVAGLPAVGEAWNDTHLEWLGLWELPRRTVGVEDHDVSLPAASGLKLRGSNPFQGSARLRFEIATDDAQPGRAMRLDIFDVQGRLVRNLHRGPSVSGRFDVEWDGRDDAGHLVHDGVYLSRLDTGREHHVLRLVRVR